MCTWPLPHPPHPPHPLLLLQMPQARPSVVKQNRRTAQGLPSQFVSYTQSYGTISQSQLRALRQCKWWQTTIMWQWQCRAQVTNTITYIVDELVHIHSHIIFIPWPLILSYLSHSLYIHASLTRYSILLYTITLAGLVHRLSSQGEVPNVHSITIKYTLTYVYIIIHIYIIHNYIHIYIIYIYKHAIQENINMCIKICVCLCVCVW